MLNSDPHVTTDLLKMLETAANQTPRGKAYLLDVKASMLDEMTPHIVVLQDMLRANMIDPGAAIPGGSILGAFIASYKTIWAENARLKHEAKTATEEPPVREAPKEARRKSRLDVRALALGDEPDGAAAPCQAPSPDDLRIEDFFRAIEVTDIHGGETIDRSFADIVSAAVNEMFGEKDSEVVVRGSTEDDFRAQMLACEHLEHEPLFVLQCTAHDLSRAADASPIRVQIEMSRLGLRVVRHELREMASADERRTRRLTAKAAS